MRGDAGRMLILVRLLSWILYGTSHSPPETPTITRSPEKETFTCWWEAGSSGGSPTKHQLYYRRDSSVEVFECPDYHTAGNSSCYFNKHHTSVWTIYNITVASNALGQTHSQPVEDVMDIAQPHPPQNVTVSVVQTENRPRVLVRWQPPRDADTHSGWATITYEIHLRMQESRDKTSWESYGAGKQQEFNIYSPQPSACFLIQTRCKLDQGLWSDWSPPTLILIPDRTSETQSAVMVISVALTACVLSLTAGLLLLRMKLVKRFLLPPVPRPKIRGLDSQLLKSGRSEEIFRALMTPYPQIPQSYEHQVKYLVVSDTDEEKEFHGKASLEYKMGDNYSSGAPQKYPLNNQKTQSSAEELKSTDRGRLGSPGPEHEPQDCMLECEATLTGIISSQLISSTTQHLTGDPYAQLHLDCGGLSIKAQKNTQLTPSAEINNYQNEVKTFPAELTNYVEFNKGRQGQEPAVPVQEYSRISDIITGNILVLSKDSSPVWGHKDVKCDRTCNETEGVLESVGYLETASTFSSGS